MAGAIERKLYISYGKGKSRVMTTPADPALLGDETATKIVGRRRISHWYEITQKQIDAFSEATHDHQWIHQANVTEGRSPFGGPIAHGLLLVSIVLQLAREGSTLPAGDWVLNGFDKLRFLSPVPGGSHIRCLSTILGLRELRGCLLLKVRLAVEIENRKSPALIADCSLLCFKEEEAMRQML
jgi:acyl dehydratase